MRSSLPLLIPSMAVALAMVSLPVQANTPTQPAPSASLVAQSALPQQGTISNVSETTSRNLSCETLLETAGYQQAALQSVIERRAIAVAAGQESSELEKMVQDSQARLDRTQGQINTACAA